MTDIHSTISDIPERILTTSSTMRFSAVVNGFGNILYFKYREDVPKPLLPETEVEKEIILGMVRLQTEKSRVSLLGGVNYCLVTFDKIKRAIIPFGELFVLVSFDGNTSHIEEILGEKVIPLLQTYTHTAV